jgi:peptidoglycan/LPS O-acetylase OafA/YrhL
MFAILCFHARLGWAKGGFICVSIFFTMSGFLITSLVLAERERHGRIDLPAFWARRARRLIPASLVALLLAALVTVIAVPEAQRASVAGDIRASLLNFANWRFIWQGAHYADFSVVPSPVQHYWSLAIEEQFYLVFPILATLALARGRAVLAWAFGGIAVLSFLQQFRIDGIDRVYFGTDTRAAEIVIGGLLAIAYPRIRELSALHRWRLADIGGLVGIAASVVIFLATPHARTGIYEGGLGAFAAVSCLMVIGSVEGPIVQRILGFRPFVELGKMSYGAYLYHFPLYLLLDEERTNLDGYALFGVRLAATLAACTLSFHLFERPIRVGAMLTTRTARLGLAGGFAAVLLVGLPVARTGEDEQRLAFRPLDTTSTTSTSSTSTTTVLPGGEPGTTAATAPTTTIAPARPPRVVVVGDSTAKANGDGLEHWGVESGRLQVVTVHEPGCGPLLGIKFKIREGYEFQPHRCDELFPKAAAAARELDADAIVVFIGSSQLADWEYADLEGLHHLGEPVIDSRYGLALDRVLGELAGAEVPILWATVPLPKWDLEVFSDVIGSPVPGDGPITLNDPPRTVRLNELNQANVPGSSLAALWPYAARLAGPDGEIPKRIRPDGLHLSESGVREVAGAWLFDELGAAFRAVVAADSPRLGAVERHSWSAPGAPLP